MVKRAQSEPKKLLNSLQYCLGLQDVEQPLARVIMRFHRDENHTVEEWDKILEAVRNHIPK